MTVSVFLIIFTVITISVSAFFNIKTIKYGSGFTQIQGSQSEQNLFLITKPQISKISGGYGIFNPDKNEINLYKEGIYALPYQTLKIKDIDGYGNFGVRFFSDNEWLILRIRKIDLNDAKNFFTEGEVDKSKFTNIAKWFLYNQKNNFEKEIAQEITELQYFGINKFEMISILNSVAVFQGSDKNGLYTYFRIENQEFVEAPEFTGYNSFGQKINNISFKSDNFETTMSISTDSQKFIYDLSNSEISNCDEVAYVDNKKITCFNLMPNNGIFKKYQLTEYNRSTKNIKNIKNIIDFSLENNQMIYLEFDEDKKEFTPNVFTLY